MTRGPTRAAATAVLCLIGGAAPLAAQETHLLLISGLAGEPAYADLFHSQGSVLFEAAVDRWGVPAERVTWLAEDPARAPERIDGRSTREAVEREITALAGRAGARDQILVVILGHGSGSGGESKLNLPGPDLAAGDLAVWLAAFPTQTIAIVNTTSASGGFVPALSGERRIVVTATRSPRERNQTHFGSFFVHAFSGEGADTDKDDRVSLLEAFTYARIETERFYARDNRLLTEHALLDDDGDGEGSLEPDPAAGDGRLASRFFLASERPAVAARAADDPELARLIERRRELENAVTELTVRKDELEPAAYEAELERLLLELAAVNRAIRERGEEP